MSNIIVSPQITPFIQTQFPRFYDEEGPQFIEFVKAYYEWLEQEGMSVAQARQLFSERDVDTTTHINMFARKYMPNFPISTVIYDKRFLVKHIQDIYRSKGSIQGYKLLFKLLYDDDIEIYLPAQDMFAASDGTWYEPKYLELVANSMNPELVGRIVKGSSSKAEAVVESFVQQPVNNKIINIAYLSNITGSFVQGEKIVPEDVDDPRTVIFAAPKVLGSLQGLNMVQGGQKFKVGDTLVAVDGNGAEAEARVARVANGTGTLAFSVGAGGLLFSMDAIEIISRDPADTTGRGASFDIGSITSIETVSYNNDIILEHANEIMGGWIDHIQVANSGSGYTNGQSIIIEPRYHVADVQPVTGGINYANGDIIQISGNNAITNAYCTVTTDDLGHMLAVDILTPGVFANNAAPILTYQLAKGGVNANVQVTLSNPGSNAVGYIVTDNSGHISEGRISSSNGVLQSGQDFVAPPRVLVANSSGTGAVLNGVVYNELPFDSNNVFTVTMNTPLSLSLDFVTKNFGSIGSLTNIATGNNYSAEPDVLVRDLITSKHALPGQIYYANTSKTVTGIGTNFTEIFKPGDFIQLIADPATRDQVDNRIVKTIANNTSLTIDDNARWTSNGAINKVFVTAGGNGYSNGDTVVVSGPGTGALIRISTDLTGAILIANVVRGGSGYYTPPDITVTSNTGSGALFYTESIQAIYHFSTPVFPANFDLTDLPPRLVANNSYPGTNEHINAPPIFGTGIIKDVQIKNSGFGYDDGEFIRFATYGAVNPIIIVDGGSGYANNDALVFTGGNALTPAAGVVSTDDKGVIKFIALTYTGSGYKFVPEVRVISKTGKGSELLATIGGLNTQYNISGYAVVGGMGTTKGMFTTTKGFPSSDKYIQDSYYYQAYSYEIQSSLTLEQYESTIKPLFHPAGTEMFGKTIKIDNIEATSDTVYDEIVSTYLAPSLNPPAELNYTKQSAAIYKFMLGL
jgi:hypothetical protein